MIYSDARAAGVRHDTTAASSEVVTAAELKLLMLYAGHVLADLGRKPWALDFSEGLAKLADDEYRSAFIRSRDIAFGGEAIHVGEMPEPRTARVGFGAWLAHFDEFVPAFFLLADQRQWRLKVHMPWRDRRNANHYFTTSIVLLLHHLVVTNDADPLHQDRLFTGACLVADLHRDGDLRLPTAWTKAVTISAEGAFGMKGHVG